MFNILLQVLDDGRLTDGQGRTVDFRNTLIILTSNLGGEILAQQESGHDSSEIRSQVMDVVRASFRPEFLNRLDEMILFHRLFPEHMGDIVDIQLAHLRTLLAGHSMSLDLDGAAKTWLSDKGYDPTYGARPLKRVIQRFLQNPLAGMILDGQLHDGAAIDVTEFDGNLMVNGVLITAD